ncbi:PREDICTED: uncharacterized protein LOC108360099 [Rhagoletis zephyria]|uniref:uncharacterized protein LOC108360099 n=1 Tax=Rhagoletis zephyria TaxID=28612 RepID=UPI000811646D|nr:PREDICTED: uncharacterized protein LOC108360099 [Rhagoletis zephyria]
MLTGNFRGFQYYLDNFFKFPKEIKNDIVYCQRSLKAHIKVHQMVIDVFQQEEGADPAQKQRILDEIESEIYEINAEQHFLFLRLRRIIDEFSKMLKRNDVPMDYGATNAMISRHVVPLINDPTIEILPSTVLFRNTEQKLIEKYFEVQKEKVVYEIKDSDEEDNLPQISEETIGMRWSKSMCEMANETLTTTDTCSLQGPNSFSQMSLLKPISQRMVGNVGIGSDNFGNFPDASRFLQMNLVEEKNIEDQKNAALALDDPSKFSDVLSKNDVPNEQLIDLPVSKNVKISRLNLRQALNKARTENMVAKAAANMLARSTPTSTINQYNTRTDTAITHPQRRYEIRTRAARNNAGSAVSIATLSKERNSSELNSSSEDSNPEPLPMPAKPHIGFIELTEHRTLPEHYGQEMFLRLFQLFTPTVLVQMQQRRSKRKRRSVHNNERADFHYGRIEYGSYPPPEKKRKAFLLSPQIKRDLQSKRPKRPNIEKNEDIVTSRSSSSSPDEKRCCNECLRSGGCFEQCVECKGYYHQLCQTEYHEEIDSKIQNMQLCLCPACRRSHPIQINKEAQQYKQLHSTAEDLEKKLSHEKDRRASLQQESKMYKLQMRKLFNIVNTIKSDQENESSG